MTARTRLLPLVALAAVLALAGCGDGGVNSTPTPTPTPVSYTKLTDLTGDRTFNAVGVHFDLGSTPATIISNPAIDTPGSGLTIAYNAASSTYTLTAPGAAVSSFGPADLDTTGATTGIPGAYFKSSGSGVEVLSFATPLINGVALNYTAVGAWTYISTARSFIYLAAGGMPTIASDMPKSGSATYNAAVQANLFDSTNGAGYVVDQNTGSATFSADFGAGTIATSVHLNSAATPSSAAQDFGTFTGSGAIASGTSAYTGTFAGTATSGFSGGFFGPQAGETAYSFYLSTSAIQAAGTVWGKKN